MPRLALALLALLTLGAAQAAAQTQPASLVADRVRVAGETLLIAEGAVEVTYGTTRLTASRVVFDQASQQLDIQGPITVQDGDEVLILADEAALASDLRDGLLRSARMVLARQLQLAANRIDRVDGRYTQLTKAVASSCQVCAANPVPTWEIRAKRIVHDQLERQLYFDSATFRLAGVPIFYLPRLRLPDPTLRRARGFLLPSLRTTSRLGAGLKLPYFLPLGDRADLTFTPYLSPNTRTLELRHRHELRFGGVTFEGALTSDDLEPGSRYYLFGEGAFRLPGGFRLEFDIETVSDPAYLLDYGYSEQDRLASEVRIERARRDELIEASVTGFRTLRAAEQPIRDELPGLYGRLAWERRLWTGGGQLTFGLDAATLNRPSSGAGVGRDVQRLGVTAEYRLERTFANGMIGTATAGVSAFVYNIDQDPAFDPQVGQMTPRLAAELRWPFQKTAASGAVHLLEPVAQLVWARTQGDRVPDEDSVLVEFDEGNLYAFSRFAGEDRFEEGARANLGLSWTRWDPAGWSANLTFGRVLRTEDAGQFPAGSGLDGTTSDWLVAGRLMLDDRLTLTNRALFDGDFDFTRNETRLSWRGGRSTLGATYLWLEPSPAQNRPAANNELTLDASYRLTRNWTGSFGGRFDLDTQSAARAGLGLAYRSECITVDLSLSRRFTSSTSVAPTTDFGLQVSLAGFGNGGETAAAATACRG